jgi:ferredoxin-thioredoxin reductase catalytic subunit
MRHHEASQIKVKKTHLPFCYFSSFLYGILVGKLEEKRSFGRHGCRCNNIKMLLNDMV